MTHPHSRPSRLVDRHARADQAPEASNSGQDTSDLPPPAPGGATTTGVTKRTERGEEARAGQMSPAVAFIAGEARFFGDPTPATAREEGRRRRWRRPRLPSRLLGNGAGAFFPRPGSWFLPVIASQLGAICENLSKRHLLLLSTPHPKMELLLVVTVYKNLDMSNSATLPQKLPEKELVDPTSCLSRRRSLHVRSTLQSCRH